MGTPDPPPGPGDSFAARFAASRPASDAAGLAALALRTGSPAVVDILSAAPPAPPWRVALARVRALWPHDPGPDLEAGADLYRAVMADHGPEAFDEASGGLFAQVALSLGLRQETARLLDTVPMDADLRWSVETDLLDPSAAEPGPGSWAEGFSRAFAPWEPVDLAGGDGPPFERLAATASTTAGGDLVSVVMPAFRPDDGIVAAARSILAQTWADLELIVVDDGSPAEFRDVFDAVAVLDQQRVRIVRADENGGTYVARNLGLDAAAGAYVTFHDADDWAHPRRIETQVRPLLDDSSLLATRSRAIRAFPDLRLTYPGYPPTRVNASSLLFRRERVLELVGHFDAVRKSGDVEYPARLRAIAPRSVIDLDGPPLSVVQLRPDSLSRSDSVPGWLHWERREYRDRYREWHARIRAGLSEARLPARTRPFPLPATTWAPRPPAGADAVRHVDVVYLDDWRRSRPDRFAAATEIRTLIGAGLSVAVADAEALVPLAADREDRSWLLSRLQVEGVPYVHLHDTVTTDLLVVADPGVLQILPDGPHGLRAASVAVLDGSGGGAAQESARGYRVGDCEAAAERVFGVRPVWVPRDLPAPGAVVRTPRRLGLRPVIGHHLPDAATSWPLDARRILAVYPDDGSFDVRVLRAGRSAAAVLGSKLPPPSWVAFDREPMTAADFLRQLDVFVYFGKAGRTDGAARSALEAMANGCVAVLPAAFADDFGDAAVYATEETAAATIRDLHADSDRFEQQRARGLAVATTRAAAFVERLSGVAAARPR